MVSSVVNLDAMIPREDMLTPAGEYRGSPPDKISITDLDAGFFSAMLRKPDFQRETAHWTPEKIAELIRAFVDGDLIPAVILWRRGTNVFVIDGAHRISAIIAWVKDDYGSGKTSLEHFGGRVSDEQKRIAERTRKLVNQTVGPFAQLAGARLNPKAAEPDIQAMLGNLAANAIVAQWVPQVDEKAAEESFFKINQAATPIDATERQILRSRLTPNAIAARAIVRGGTGHKYWSAFQGEIKQSIESKSSAIHAALYEPPLGTPLKTLDVPVAGRGYSALPFIYELVNWANEVPEPPKNSRTSLQDDLDGQETVKYLSEVSNIVDLITGTEMKSLGLHPLVYFYTRGGEFQPNIFIAVAAAVKSLASRKKLPEFTRSRAKLENFLLENKDFVTLIVKKTGAKTKSHGRLTRYFEKLVTEFSDGKNSEQVMESLANDAEFRFLTAAILMPAGDEDSNPTRRFSRATKSASFFEAALPGAVRCGICGALVHVNSMQVDHIEEASKGGNTDARNAQITHPYCNSAKSALKISN